MQLTNQQVEALAPDKAAVARAKKLGEPRNWSGLGSSERAIWGECKGSSTYQVRVDLSDLASKCSCPSRQLPCKHTLGLLFLAAQRPKELAAGAEPEWVADWITRRQAAAQAKATKKAQAREGKAPVDAAAQAKRVEKREEKIADGLDQLDRWLSDLVRVGLASVEQSSPGIFEEEARRLVDAQASGLAGWVRRLSTIPLSGSDWPARLLAQLGRIALLTRAYRGLERLDPALQLDVRQQIGWSMGQDEVLAHGDRVRDRWQVIAQEVIDDERLRTQRTWLMGQATGQAALIL
ncbi:MAG: SWIM zinc finger family protein, partial [Myxococcales bacterium]|nr:SWIM zinc finger family protein [Myxococcales bacterium]